MTIDEVLEDGLAAKIGLLKGDRIVKIGEQAIADRDEMRTAIREAPVKSKVVVLRSGKEVEVAVEFLPTPVRAPGSGVGSGCASETG